MFRLGFSTQKDPIQSEFPWQRGRFPGFPAVLPWPSNNNRPEFPNFPEPSPGTSEVPKDHRLCGGPGLQAAEPAPGRSSQPIFGSGSAPYFFSSSFFSSPSFFLMQGNVFVACLFLFLFFFLRERPKGKPPFWECPVLTRTHTHTKGGGEKKAWSLLCVLCMCVCVLGIERGNLGGALCGCVFWLGLCSVFSCWLLRFVRLNVVLLVCLLPTFLRGVLASPHSRPSRSLLLLFLLHRLLSAYATYAHSPHGLPAPRT